MRKVTSLLFVLLTSFLMFTASTTIGQVQVGDGTVVSKALPVEPYYGYTYSQVIYLASEINTSGDITTLSYYFAGSSLSNSNDWTIYIGHTTKTEFASTTDWIDVTTLTQVYSGVFANPGGAGWIEFDITDFAYNGTDNIVVAVDENAASYNGTSDDFYCTTVATNRGLVYRNDGTNPDPLAPPTATYNYPNIANIIFGGIAQACPVPTGLTADNITTTSVELSWNPGGSETMWDVAFGEPGFDPDTEGTILAVTQNPYVLDVLSAASVYDVYVRADCATDEVSLWSGVISIITQCETFTAPYSEDFENGGLIPVCWAQGAGNLEPWKFSNTGSGNHIGNNGIMGGATTSGGYFAWVDDSSPDSDSTILLTPFIDVSGLTIPNLSFFIISNNEGHSNVDFSVNLWDGSMWQEQIFFHNENTLNGEWQQFFVNLSAYTISGPIQLAFVVDEIVASDFYDDIALDDVLVGEAPSCFPPTLFTALDFTTTSATFGWTPGGDEVAWDLAWGDPGFDPDTEGTIVPVTENPFTLEGLVVSTQYHAYLRADCSTDEVSTWTGPVAFATTQIPAELPLVEDFEIWPNDWAVVNGDMTNQWHVGGVTYYEGTQAAFVSNDNGVSNAYTITSSSVSHLFRDITFPVDAPGFELKFWWKGQGEGASTFYDYMRVFLVETSVLPAAGTQITTGQIGDTYNLQADWQQEMLLIPDTFAGGTYRLVFSWRNDGSVGTQPPAAVDGIEIAVLEIGMLEGTVSEATRGPVENAHIIAGEYEAYTDASGYYMIADMFAGLYDITCEAEGYYPTSVESVEIVANQTTTQDFELGYAQIAVNPASLLESLPPDGMSTQTLTISNPGGTEPLNWSASIELLEVAPRYNAVPVTFGETINLPSGNSVNDICTTTSIMKGDLTDAAWDILQSFSTFEASEQAVGTDGQYIYTTKWNAAGVFGKYALDGTFIENFTIASAAGIRDFAYDGQYFYGGASGSTLFILDLTTQTQVGTIALQGGATCRHIAYDPTIDGFWVGNWTTLFQVDKTGAILQTGPAVVSVYGSAYDGVTAGGPYLWLFAQVGTEGCGDPVNDLVTLQQFDIATMSFTGVVHCATDIPGYVPGNSTDQTIAGGAFATDLLFPGKFVLMVNVQQSPNLVGVYELASLESWLSLDIYNGSIAPNESQEVTVSFDATGLIDTNYYANININHNGQELMDGTLTVPVELIVASAAAPAAPTNPMPVSGAEFVSLQPEFSWTNGAGTATVRFSLVAETFPFATPVHTSPWFIGETYNLADVGITLQPKTNYSWRITCRNSAGSTSNVKWLFQTLGIGSIGGVVTDNYTTLPLEGVEVSTDDGMYSVLTLADGTYLIDSLFEGNYNVTAELGGYVSQTIPTTVVHGQNSLVNFALDTYLEPAFGLQAVVEDFVNVNLTWNAPGGAWTPVWLTYSQETITNSIGTNGAANFDVAARFTPDQLTELPGGSLTKIQFVPGEADLLCTYTLKVWQGASPPTLIYEQELATVTADVWNEIELDSPVPYDNTEELWFGFNCNTTGGFPAGCDPGPQDEGFGNMIYWSGAWTTLTQLGATLTYNWAVKGYVEVAKGAVALDPIKGVSKIQQNSGTLASRTNKIDPPTISITPESSRALLGYNVYRNDELLVNTVETFHNDLDLEAGDYFYSVKALYDQGESEAVGPKGVSILAPPVLLSAEGDYYGVQLEWVEGSSVPVEAYLNAKQLTSNVKPVLKKERNTTPVDPGIYLTRSGKAIGDSCENPATAVLGLNSAPGMPYWYEYTPTMDVALTISSCVDGQEVDTDLEVYDACDGALIAANDDLMAACGSYIYSSAVTFNALAGVTYKIYWIDTWETSAFDFTIDEADVCVVTCPDGSLSEPELCGEDLNGGCNADVPGYTPISGGDVFCGTAFAYDGSRDTDWYELVLDAPKTITWSVTAEFPALAFILNGTDGCASYFVEGSASAGNCETAVVTATVPPGVYWLWVGNQGFYGNPCGDYNDYVAELTLEDAFLSYYNVFRDGVDIADVYGATSYYDMDVTNGEGYCYTVSQVLNEAALETGVSNELCAVVTLIPTIEVNPLALTETHLTPPAQLTTQTVTVSNTGAGSLDWSLAVSLEPLTDGSKAYCDASTTNEDETIGNVLCGDIDNSSGWQGGVADYTAISTLINPGETEAITVTNTGNPYTADMTTCWVDWNNDEVFDVGTDEEFVLASDGIGAIFTGAITVPEGTPEGAYRMRVRIMWNTAPVPCGLASYGEVEDYTIMVGAPANEWLSADVLSGTLASGESADVTVSFNSEGLMPGQYNGGLTITSNDPMNPLTVVTAQLDVAANMGTLSGYVTNALAKGPVQGVTITAEEIRYSTTTDEQGYYEMELPVGMYNVSASKAGYTIAYAESVMIEFETTTMQDFMLGFAAPVLLSAEGNFFDVITTWEGNPLFTGATDGSVAGVSASYIQEMDKSDLRAQKEKLLQGPYKQVNKDVKVTRGPGESCAEAVTALEGANSCAGAPYWYEFTPAEDMFVNLSSCLDGQAVDTKLYVYDACEGTQVAYNDDLYSACSYYSYASAVSFPATAGVSYKIFWDPYWSSDSFDFILETEAISAGLTCETALPAAEGLNTSPQAPYWFEFTPAEDKALTITSCIDGQAIDTDLEVYDACGGTLVAANDDLLGDCGAYQYASGVTFNCTAGVTYKISWLSTWSSDGFDFFIELNDLCAVECPPDAIAEGEPCPEDEYVDNFNSGCNSAVPVFTSVNCGDVVCGTASNYLYQGSNRRDTDWYELVIDEPKVVTFAVTAEFPIVMGLLEQFEAGVPGCENITGYIAPYSLGVPCVETSIEVTLIPGTYYFFVSINGFTGYPCGTANNYVASWECTDIFITYYNLYRDGNAIATTYGNSYIDMDVAAGETYCYTVDQVFMPDMVSGMSNELCANVPFAPEIAVSPDALFESLEIGETSTQNVTITNNGLGDLNYDVEVILYDGTSATSVLFEDGFENYNAADYLAQQANALGVDEWTTWSLAPGTGEDPFVSSDQASVGSNSFVVETGNDCVLHLGNQTSGEYDLEFDMFVASGFQGFFDVLHSFDGGVYEWGIQVYFDLAGAGLVDAGGAGTASFTYAYDQWLPVKMHINLNTDWAELYIDGNLVVEYQWSLDAASGAAGLNQLAAANFYAWEDGATAKYYIDNVKFTSLVVEPWLSVTPLSGTIVPGKAFEELDANFNATALEVGTYNADIVINSNDPMYPEFVIPVQLLVGAMTQNIVMPAGWSAWSSYISSEMAMEDLMAPVFDQMIVTQYFNQLYYPAYGINNMGNFTNAHGYLSKMTDEVTLSLSGFMADPTVYLTQGWNLMPVLQDCSIPAADVFSGMAGLVIAWDPVGNGIYYPAGNLFTLVDLNPGMAYWVKVDADVSYTYPGCTKSGGANSTSLRAFNNTNWNDVNYTPVNHAVVFDANAVVSLQAGDMIGAFTANGWCAGLVEYNGNNLGFNLFGDDMTTDMADGFVEGAYLYYRLFRPATEEEFDIEVTYSFDAPNADGLFAVNGLSVVTDLKLSPTSVGANLLNGLSIYPNPSSGIFNIALNNIDEDINYVVLNAQGQEVYRGNLLESQELDLSDEPRGVYFIKFMNNGVLGIEKLVIK